MATGDPISLHRRTTSEVDPYRMELSHGAMRVQYDLDLNAPSQRFIYDCCQGGGVYEATTAFLLTQVLRPGDTFVDVGAHVGFFAMIAAAIVGPSGRVVAFEPNAENFAALQNNATLNGFAQVTCINSAVGDRDGEAAFFENLDNDGGHALWDPGLHPFNEQSRDRQAVRRLPIARLDTVLPSLGIRSVKAVKIDTEGAEVQVLDGGRQCLAAPDLALLVCEDNEFGLERMGTSGIELRRVLDRLGFAVCVLDGKGGLQQVAVDASHQSASVDNFYCVRPPKS